MIPWKLLDTSLIPGTGDTLRLMQRGTEFSIKLGQNELMNSRLSGSEEALATLSCQRIAGRTGARVLIGGLGMGFTLRAALSVLPAQATIVVAELVPAVIAWARGPMSEVFQNSLHDPRVEVLRGDVLEAMKAGSNAYDAILLDVDNGPEGLTRGSNDNLYDRTGLQSARMALRAEGFWRCGRPDPTPRLRNASGARDLRWRRSRCGQTVHAAAPVI